MHVLLRSLYFHNLYARFAYALAVVILAVVSLPALVSAQVSDTPDAPVITSETFNNETTWYRLTSGIVSWSIPSEITRIAAEVVSTEGAEPMIPYDTTVTELMLTADVLSEGEQYFALQFRNENGWGEVAYLPIRIDTISPKSLSVDVVNEQEGEFPEIVFTAEDEGSGIVQFEYVVHGENVATPVTPQEGYDGIIFDNREDGVYTLTATAFDYAGNTTSHTFEVTVVAGWKPPVDSPIVETATEDVDWVPAYLVFDIDSVIDAQLFTTIVLTCMIFTLLYLLREERTRYNEREELFEMELESVHGQITHIFSTLRADMFKNLNEFDAKPKRSSVAKKTTKSK